MKRTEDAGTTKDLLAHLLTRDCQATTDTLLHALSESDDKDDNDDDDGNDGNDGEIENGLHNDDVEGNDADEE